jgi:glycosyltransferase involved in cell wall biosynthesis
MNCYNGEKFLREAIESVLAQTYLNWELIFWDNQSTDQSASIFKRYQDSRLKYYRSAVHTDLGGGRASAFHHLSGEYVAVLDVDDLWLPSKLEKQIPLFRDSDVGLVICDTLFFNDNREKVLYGKKRPPTGWVFEKLLENYFVSLETLMFRRATALRLPRAFDSEFSFIADFDLVVRLSRISKLAYYPEALARWRVHSESDTWKYPMAMISEKERWIKKQVDEDSSFYSDHKKIIEVFHRKSYREKAISSIIQKDRWGGIRNLMRTKLIQWQDWVLFFFCFLPFSDIVLSYYFRRKFLLQ